MIAQEAHRDLLTLLHTEDRTLDSDPFIITAQEASGMDRSMQQYESHNTEFLCAKVRF